MGSGSGLIMNSKNFLRFAMALAVALAAGIAQPGRAATGEEGLALAIVYDTSGSMKLQVPDGAGKLTPKYIIARRALESVLQQLQKFSTNSSSGGVRKIEAGLFAFRGTGIIEVVKFRPFDPKDLASWTSNLPPPISSTPLGAALSVAGRKVLESRLTRKHVLVITDGLNTAGPDPKVTMPKLKDQAAKEGAALSVHFVAFDVDAKVFAPLKMLGATVVGAADEKQLNTQLEFILQRKILLEDEEVPVKK
jgi:hypothetical protein